jgi:uncharacterized protein
VTPAGLSAGWRERVIEYIERAAQPREKFGHQVRLYALTREIGRDLVYDDDVVFAAAWLHDIGVFIGHRPESVVALAAWDNVAYAAERAPDLLREFGFPGDVAAVVEAIRTHQAKAEPRSIEAELVRDADVLEQLGAIGVLRAVCKIGRDTRYKTFSDVRPVLVEAVEYLPGRLRLTRARELAVDRVRMLRAFVDAMDGEAGAGLL